MKMKTLLGLTCALAFSTSAFATTYFNNDTNLPPGTTPSKPIIVTYVYANPAPGKSSDVAGGGYDVVNPGSYGSPVSAPDSTHTVLTVTSVSYNDNTDKTEYSYTGTITPQSCAEETSGQTTGYDLTFTAATGGRAAIVCTPGAGLSHK